MFYRNFLQICNKDLNDTFHEIGCSFEIFKSKYVSRKSGIFQGEIRKFHSFEGETRESYSFPRLFILQTDTYVFLGTFLFSGRKETFVWVIYFFFPSDIALKRYLRKSWFRFCYFPTTKNSILMALRFN